MDTISREGNSSMLPVGGIIVGVVALLLGGYAAITLSKVNRAIADHDAKLAKIDSVEAQVGTAAADAARANKAIADNDKVYRNGFDQIVSNLTQLATDVTTLKEAAKKPAPAPSAGGKAGSAPAVAGPDEYIVKPGDGGSKIAAAHGVSIAELTQVNPGVEWTKLKPGQKLKLPSTAKK